MTIKTWRFVTIILAALAMGMKLAHTLELPPKLAWDADLYLAVQTSLYSLFGTIGPLIEVGALLCATALAVQVRRSPAFPLTLASVAAIVLSLGIWLIVVLPANMQIAQWATTLVIPPDWSRWRAQWQFGQAATFVAHLVGLSALLISVIRETPAHSNESLPSKAVVPPSPDEYTAN